MRESENSHLAHLAHLARKQGVFEGEQGASSHLAPGAQEDRQAGMHDLPRRGDGFLEREDFVI